MKNCYEIVNYIKRYNFLKCLSRANHSCPSFYQELHFILPKIYFWNTKMQKKIIRRYENMKI